MAADGCQLPLLSPAPGARWTAVELDLLRQHYTAGGLTAAQAALPHRSAPAIYMACTKYKIRAPRQANTVRRRWSHDPRLDDEIRAQAMRNAGRGTWQTIAVRWGRPLWYVQRRAHDLGVQLPRHDARAWTEAETDLLHETAHLSAGQAALTFRRRGTPRTATAIQTRRHLLSIERSDNGVYSERGLSLLLGCGHTTIARAIKRGDLRARQERKGDPTSRWQITERAIRDWLAAQPYAIDLRRVPPASQALLITALTNR